MQLTYVKGDLFGAPSTDSLAHCISEDCRMGKGIAVAFKEKFGGITELQKQVAQGAKTGRVAVLQRDDRYVYYLITKPRVFNKPTYETLRSSLEHMREHAEEHGVRRISMPRIGCGLDGLHWGMIEPMLRDVFVDTEVQITVYQL